MCGAEGTLGIITRLTMRLLPKPEAALTVMALFSSVRLCAEAANHLIEEKIIPSKLELIDGQALKAIRAYIRDEKIETACPLRRMRTPCCWSRQTATGREPSGSSAASEAS